MFWVSVPVRPDERRYCDRNVVERCFKQLKRWQGYCGALRQRAVGKRPRVHDLRRTHASMRGVLPAISNRELTE